jgi:hypothetical protein
MYFHVPPHHSWFLRETKVWIYFKEVNQDNLDFFEITMMVT